MNNTDKENDLIKDLYKRRGEFISEAKIMIAQALCAADIEDAGGDTYIDNFCEGYFQGRVSSFTGEITSLKAELEKARELIEAQSKFLNRFKDGFYLNNSFSELVSLYKDLTDFEIGKVDEFLKTKEGE